jgi:tripartite-type tricarboxylate transporter receptor subunit TctC
MTEAFARRNERTPQAAHAGRCSRPARCPAARPSRRLASAGDFPNKPIRMVVTFPPGGSADAVVRMLVPRLNEKLGQQVVVDNRPGAGGNVGLALVAKAPADGYTLGVGAAGALTANAACIRRCPSTR